MAISLNKGQKISLAKAATDAGLTEGPKRLLCGLGWDINKYDGGSAFDLDASVFLCGADGKVFKDDALVFYGQKEAYGVKHDGDNLTGEGEGDDEAISIDLDALPAEVERIAIAVTIYEAEARNQTFGMVSKSYVRLIDADTNTELCSCELGEDASTNTAVVLCELYKHNGEWKVDPVKSGFNGGLNQLCSNYGIALQ